MVRRFGFLFGPRWLALHVVVVAACVTMVLLGRWQWHVAHVHHGSIQNYSYAFQWWAFTAFAVFMWLRLVHDAIPPASVYALAQFRYCSRQRLVKYGLGSMIAGTLLDALDSLGRMMSIVILSATPL